ncbi:MAG: DinB family protein [Phycisphaerales bacterium]|nr:DinB family protein [Phycisphaerales bacterium]
MNEYASLSESRLIDRYEASAGLPAAGIRGLSTGQLLGIPVPGGWSIQQIVMHLADSDPIGSYRMKRVIAHENPKIDAYDESAFARRLGYDHQDLRTASEHFRLNRVLTAAMLRTLAADAWERAGVHEERGRLTLRQLVEIYTEHAEHHMRFLDRKREMVQAK